MRACALVALVALVSRAACSQSDGGEIRLSVTEAEVAR